MLPFASNNMRAGAVKPRVNNVIKFLYSLGLALRGRCQLNNCYYLTKKHFAGARM